MLDDLRFALRRLRHSPGFAAVAILTLAVGVGANTAILSIADGVLFRPLPYRDPDRVFLLQMIGRPSGNRYTSVSLDFVRAIADRHQGLSEVGLGGRGGGPRILVDTPDGVDEVSAAAVTASYFRVLGVTPARGRLFADADTPGRTIVLSHTGWLRRFGGDAGVVGRTVTLGASSFDVVGVLPADFQFPTVFIGKPEVVALQAPPAPGVTGGTFHPIVRLEPGVTREQAQAEIETLVAPLTDADPRLKGSAPFLENIRDVIYPIGRPMMRFLLAAALLVLLVGCANLANMMLARNRRQERETAVRTALGASRMRLVRPLVFEAMLLGVAASALAVVLTKVTFEALLRQVPNAAYGNAIIGLDIRVTLMGLALGILGGLVFAVAPAWRSARLDVLALIQGRHRSSAARTRFGRPMVAVQVAVAVVLAFGAAVATRAFVSVLNQPLGFDPDHVVRIEMRPPSGTTDYPAFFQTVVDGLRRHPDVVAVGASGSPPLSGMAPWSSVRQPGSNARVAGVVHVMPGYFEALGVRPTVGRLLAPEDPPGGPAAVVSESAARALFGGANPVGQTISQEKEPLRQVVGVVPDVRSSFGPEQAPPVYVVPSGRTTPLPIFARVKSRSESVLTTLRREAGRLGPGAPVAAAWWTDDLSGLTVYKNPRFQTIVLGAFATIALGLTALGIFGVVAFLVTARAREMGVRIAVGAAPASLVRLVTKQTLIPVVAGLVLGLIATRWAAKLAEAQLFAVQTRDPWMLAMTAATVVVAAILAAWLPARRAARVDPILVLRTE